MNESKKQSKIKRFVTVVLIAIFFIIGTVGFTYATYIISVSISNAAQTAKWGTIELKECQLSLEDGVYQRTDNESKIQNGSIFSNAEPEIGMVIHKAPFIVVGGTFEVAFALYVKVEEVNVSLDYEIETGWVSDSDVTKGGTRTRTYKYDGEIVLGEKIFILENDKLTLKNFMSGASDYRITFSAWIEQI